MSEKPCAVRWCGAIATKGEFCAVHAATPHYDPEKPDNVTPLEEPAAQEPENGSGKGLIV